MTVAPPQREGERSVRVYSTTGGNCKLRTIGLALLAAIAGTGEPRAATTAATEALRLCAAADAAPPAERVEMLSRGLRCAEEAERTNSRDAAAHFAIFCNLGKLTRLRRESSGWLMILGDVTRARRELDQALALAPDYAAALAAKGRMLMELPRWLGGDPELGRILLQRADSSGAEIYPGSHCDTEDGSCTHER